MSCSANDVPKHQRGSKRSRHANRVYVICESVGQQTLTNELCQHCDFVPRRLRVPMLLIALLVAIFVMMLVSALLLLLLSLFAKTTPLQSSTRMVNFTLCDMLFS